MIRISLADLHKQGKFEQMTDDVFTELLFRIRYRAISGMKPFYELEWDDNEEFGEQGIISHSVIKIIEELKIRFGDVVLIP